MKKVIVTGALGFIGFSLSLRLLEKGYEVVGIDGMVDKRLKDLNDEKLLWIGRNAQFTLINEKIEELDLKEVMNEVDVIYHLASATSRGRNWDDLRTTIEDNVGVTEKIVSASNRKSKIIYTSSTQVYGDRSGTITEKTPLNPFTPYSLTKMAAEAVIKTKCQELKIPYVIFRIPTIYGPWQRVDMTYTQLFLNEMMKISKEVDDDQVKEDVLYIDDILDTLIEAGNKRDCKNEIFNLSTGKINEWYRGRSLINKHQSTKPQDERLQVTISNEKVKEQLGFHVTTSLAAGLKAQKNHIIKYKHLYLK